MVRNVSVRKAVENYEKKKLQSTWPGLNTQSNLADQSPPKIEQVGLVYSPPPHPVFCIFIA